MGPMCSHSCWHCGTWAHPPPPCLLPPLPPLAASSLSSCPSCSPVVATTLTRGAWWNSAFEFIRQSSSDIPILTASFTKYDKLMNWSFDELIIWWTDENINWQTDKPINWCWTDYELMKWLMNWWIDELMMNWQTDELINWWPYHELIMINWWNDELINWWNDELINWLTDDKLMNCCTVELVKW